MKRNNKVEQVNANRLCRDCSGSTSGDDKIVRCESCERKRSRRGVRKAHKDHISKRVENYRELRAERTERKLSPKKRPSRSKKALPAAA